MLALFFKEYIADILLRAPIQSKSFTMNGLIWNTCLYWTNYCLLDGGAILLLNLIPKSKNINARITYRKYTILFISSLSCSDYIVQLDWLRPKWTEYFTMQICQKNILNFSTLFILTQLTMNIMLLFFLIQWNPIKIKMKY